ncbi:MAG: AI-2E family transporter [Chloroflexia bacterium]|nr:AI-2E family transporter [Chloroflexia bacterium]
MAMAVPPRGTRRASTLSDGDNKADRPEGAAPRVPAERGAPAVRRARMAWRQLGERIATITPAGLAQLLLTVGALLGLIALIWFAWGSLFPFVVGAAIAYVLLPLVNLLDRVLPRTLAVLLIMGLVAVLGAFFLSLLVPIIVRQINEAYLSLPSPDDFASYEQRLAAYLRTLPPPMRAFIIDVITQFYDQARSNVDVYLGQSVNLTIRALLGLANTVGFVLGLIVVPTWLLAVLVDQPRGRVVLDQALPRAARAEVWAVLRILDRAFSAFVRGQLLTALITGGLVYLGLDLLTQLFGLASEARYLLLLAILAGLAQLIPSIGPFLGAIPSIFFALTIAPQLALAVVLLFFLIQQIISNLVAPRLERNIVDLHPAILILVVVALSQFGFWWILLATPITAVVRDLYRYAYGRFADPPRPAGLLPGEPHPAVKAVRRRPALVYRRVTQLRQPMSEDRERSA